MKGMSNNKKSIDGRGEETILRHGTDEKKKRIFTLPCLVNSEYNALFSKGFLIFQSIFLTYIVLLGAAIEAMMTQNVCSM